jgi:S-adenosylmethionine:tRNA ribosyltransferase-isomerase
MRVSEFDYTLPPELIAQKPLEKRDQSRMMILDRDSGDIFDALFQEFPKYLDKGDLVVLNNTKVIPARAWGKKGEAVLEFLFLEETERGIWEVLCRPAKKVKSGDTVSFSSSLTGKVIGVKKEGKRLLQFSSQNVISELKKIGFAPLPPYIKRKHPQPEMRTLDLERYQTVYSRKDGAIAAPTAGLHFTPKTFAVLKKRGVQLAHLTLDIGLATFQPVRVKRVENHRMLEETYTVSRKSARIINAAKSNSRPVAAVGTTSVRALESAFQQGKIQPGARTTDLFIYPGYTFKVVDRLLTNFHLPNSTLLMMVAAFAGTELVRKAYRHAVEKKYRFYSYGDCMLIL